MDPPNTRPTEYERLFGYREGSVCSVSSTNETASDLPGPDRLLGNLYSFGGRHLEALIGKIAEKMGYGPRVVAQRTQRDVHIIKASERASRHIDRYPEGGILYFLGDKLIKKEDQRRFSAIIHTKRKKVEKDCRRLLKYVEYVLHAPVPD